MTSSTTKRPEHIPTDFRKTIMGLQGDIPWQPIFTGAFQGWLADRKPITAGQTPAHWEPVGNDGVMGEEHGEGSRLTYGNGTTRDLEFSLLATAFSGGNIQLLFRADEENNRWYTLDLLFGWQAVAINRSQPNPDGSLAFDRLSVVNYPLEHQREYAISVAVRGHSITSYIDGALVNQLTDAPWLNGKVGLNVWHSKTLFRDIKIRHLS